MMKMPKVKKRRKRRVEESKYMDEKMNEPAAEEAGEAMPKCRKKTVGIILAIVAVAAVVLTAVFLMRNRDANVVAERFAKGIAGDMKTCVSLYAYDRKAYILSDYDDEKDFFKEMQDIYGGKIDSWAGYYRAFDISNRERLEDSFGKYDISARAYREKEISLEEWEANYWEEIDRCEEIARFDRDYVSEAKMVDVKATLKGEEDTERMVITLCMVKIRGFWKVFDYSWE